jgi:bacteriocin-like protein
VDKNQFYQVNIPSFQKTGFMKNFEQLTATELTTINGGGPLDFLNGALAGLGSALGSVGSNTGGITTGAGNALTLAGAGLGSLLNNLGNALNTIGGGLAGLLGKLG